MHRIANLVAVYLIKGYQTIVSPFLGPRCRFYPSCSQYAVDCFSRYNFIRASLKTSSRLSRCHPWHPGGVDLP